MILRLLILLAVLLSSLATASEPLHLKPRPVAPGVYAVIGDLGPPSYANEGLNNNLGFVVTGAGVVVIDSGPSERVARALHEAIKKVTSEPVKLVINTNSQGHRWLGNAYFARHGARIVAHADAVRVMREAGAMQLEATRQLLREKLDGTKLALPHATVAGATQIKIGSELIELHHFGAAHTPGDLVVWLPSRRIAFAGDIVYTGRLLALLPNGSSAGWLAAFDRLAALGPQIIVPGHGEVGSLSDARRDTRDYLVALRAEVKKRLDAGESLADAVDAVDLKQFASLENYQQLARRNVHQAYLEIEQEF